MIALSILMAAWLLADAYMFVNGYESTWFKAKTDAEKKLRKRAQES